jgi:phosphatidylserine decarboxylase
MSETLGAVDGRLFRAGTGKVASAALVAEFGRHPGPKHGLVIGAHADSCVLTAAIDVLTPHDSLTVVAGAFAGEVRALVNSFGSWVEQRVRVVDALTQADPADAVILADLVSGGADDVRTELEAVAKHLNPGGVICVAVAATPFLAGGAGEELDRQATLYGVGSDLVLRNMPPVRVHRLRYSPADASLAERMAPLQRTSSVKLTRDMHIDSNGIAAAAICLGAAVLARRARRSSKLWLLPAFAAAPVAAFFRDPERDVPDDPAAIVAASDGGVLGVERVRDDKLGGQEFLRISVFLSVLDVHVNRAPVAGRVVDHFVVDGGSAAAMKPEAEHNVAAYTVLDTTHGTVAVAQRTGLLARRVVHRAPVGALLAKGERFGLIRFGSRTDVYLPAQAATAAVAPGDKVAGGETVIARWV